MKVKLKHGDPDKGISPKTEFTAFHPHLGRPIQEGDCDLPHWAIYSATPFSRQIIEYPRLSFEPIVSEDFKKMLDLLKRKCSEKRELIWSGRLISGECYAFYSSSGELVARFHANYMEYHGELNVLSLEELYYLHLLHQKGVDTGWQVKAKEKAYKSIIETLTNIP